MHEPLDADTLRQRRQAHRRTRSRRRRALVIGGGIAVVAVLAVVLSSGASGPANNSHGHAGGTAVASRSDGTHAAGGTAANGSATRTGSTATGARAGGHPGNAAVPVLMYHVIASPPAGAPFPGLYVAPSQFAEQMHALATAGWHAVTLDQLAANWRDGASVGAGKPSW